MKKLIVILMIALFAVPAWGADFPLAWDAVPGVDGYRIYAAEYGQPFDYTTPAMEVLAATTATVVMPDNNKEYKFVARCFVNGPSGAVYESPDSNQVEHAIVVPTVLTGP